jgi:hypothetical protein
MSFEVYRYVSRRVLHGNMESIFESFQTYFMVASG